MEENREEMQQPPKETKEEKRLPGQDVYEWVQALVCSVLTVVMLFTFAVRLIGVDGTPWCPPSSTRTAGGAVPSLPRL